MVESHRDLQVWQRAVQLSVSNDRLSSSVPRDEVFGLSSQLRRTGVSPGSNIAEGYGRLSTGEYKQGEYNRFPGMARGSDLEVQTQHFLASELSYG